MNERGVAGRSGPRHRARRPCTCNTHTHTPPRCVGLREKKEGSRPQHQQGRQTETRTAKREGGKDTLEVLLEHKHTHTHRHRDSPSTATEALDHARAQRCRGGAIQSWAQALAPQAHAAAADKERRTNMNVKKHKRRKQCAAVQPRTSPRCPPLSPPPPPPPTSTSPLCEILADITPEP